MVCCLTPMLLLLLLVLLLLQAAAGGAQGHRASDPVCALGVLPHPFKLGERGGMPVL